MRKVVVITGATDGLGKELAILLSSNYDLALCGRSNEKMQNLLSLLDETCTVYSECFDITDTEKRSYFCQNAQKNLGRIDILINNAGANTKKDKVTDIQLDDLRYMFELNCVSALAMIQNCYPALCRQKGLVVNILSSCCLFNNPLTGSYSASKDAMEGLSKILLKEAKQDGVGVCNVYPGGIDTNFRAVANHTYLRPKTVAKMILACIENEEGCVHDIVIRPDSEMNIC
ncbi:MAG: SDR family oxidoreductase [Oscillospiraceae bacterium]|nr:SDR family oxidoreductase [Oscillospiraceae bacterium]